MADLIVKDLLEPCELQVLKGERGLNKSINIADVNRPGLVLAGYTQHFDKQRIQILGRTELSFLESLDSMEALERWRVLLSLSFPCLIISRGQAIPKNWLELAHEKGLPILQTALPTTRFIGNLTEFLEMRLAPIMIIHGVLMEVYGVGLLITGESSIGKSETALELIKRGHRLVADDAVELRKVGEARLTGRAPELTRHLMEIRGLGILDIQTLFGTGSVRIEQTVNLTVRLEEWRNDKYYDRVGLDEEKKSYLNVEVPSLTVPVRPGRNLAGILEVAAMNYRLKQLGHNTAQELKERLTSSKQ